jgi:hypothetical protein
LQIDEARLLDKARLFRVSASRVADAGSKRSIRRRPTSPNKRNFPPGVCTKVLTLLGTMSRATIDDQEYFALGALDQAFQEFDEDIGIDAVLADDHEPHVAVRGEVPSIKM